MSDADELTQLRDRVAELVESVVAWKKLHAGIEERLREAEKTRDTWKSTNDAIWNDLVAERMARFAFAWNAIGELLVRRHVRKALIARAEKAEAVVETARRVNDVSAEATKADPDQEKLRLFYVALLDLHEALAAYDNAGGTKEPE